VLRLKGPEKLQEVLGWAMKQGQNETGRVAGDQERRNRVQIAQQYYNCSVHFVKLVVDRFASPTYARCTPMVPETSQARCFASCGKYRPRLRTSQSVLGAK